MYSILILQISDKKKERPRYCGAVLDFLYPLPLGKATGRRPKVGNGVEVGSFTLRSSNEFPRMDHRYP